MEFQQNSKFFSHFFVVLSGSKKRKDRILIRPEIESEADAPAGHKPLKTLLQMNLISMRPIAVRQEVAKKLLSTRAFQKKSIQFQTNFQGQKQLSSIRDEIRPRNFVNSRFISQFINISYFFHTVIRFYIHNNNYFEVGR